MMKEEIKKTEIKKLKQHGVILGILCIVSIASLALHRWIGFYALLPFGVLSAIAMLVALKTERMKTENRIHAYEEILEFIGGTRLDDLERQKRYCHRLRMLFRNGISLSFAFFKQAQ